MKHSVKKFFCTWLLGLVLTVIMLAGLNYVEDGVPAIHAAEFTVCPSGCSFSSIQSAVDAASDGDVIRVTSGTYTGINNHGGLSQIVYISKSITIQGGYNSDFTDWNPGAYPTTLDAQEQGRVIYIIGNISPTIEGFRITGGSASYGGGIYAISATAVISNNWIFNNSATDVSDGGGIFLSQSNTLLKANQITSNTASYLGGGLSVRGEASVEENIISNNTAQGGGGVLLAGGSGGLPGLGAAKLSANTISLNSAYYGGGVDLVSSGAVLTGNVIRGNRVSTCGGCSDGEGRGGGLLFDYSDAVLVNNFIVENQAVIAGAGLIVANASPQLLHNTIAGNFGGDGSGIHLFDRAGISSTVSLTNTILVSHTVGIAVTAGNTATLNSTLWYNNAQNTAGAGIINTFNDHTGDPVFVDVAAGDYHLQPSSTAVDIGIDAGVSTDFDGDARILGAAPDLGADEMSVPQITINGPTEGIPESNYTFVANVIPISGSTVFTYTWQTTGQTPLIHPSGTDVDYANLEWDNVGTQRVTVTVETPHGILTNTHTIEINTPQPGNLICSQMLTQTGFEGPLVGTWDLHYGFEGVQQVVSPKHTGLYAVPAPTFDGDWFDPYFDQKFTMPDSVISSTTTLEVSLYKNVRPYTDGNIDPHDRFYAVVLDAPNLGATKVTSPTEVARGGDSVKDAQGNYNWVQKTAKLPVAPGINLEDYAGQDLYIMFYNTTNADAVAANPGTPQICEYLTDPACGETLFYFDDITMDICTTLPALSVTKSGPATASADGFITYTLTITNDASFGLQDIVITDAVPIGAHYMNGGTEADGIVRWTVPTLVKDEVIQRSFVVTARQTIVNEDYAVTAFGLGGYEIAGTVAVPTVISVTVPDIGGTVTPSAGVTVTTGGATFTDSVNLTYIPQPITATGTLSNVGIFYELNVTYESDGQPAQPQPGQVYTITVAYQQEDVPVGVDEANLALFYWNGSDWLKEPTSVVDVNANTITATPQHFSMWAVLQDSAGEDRQLFLPLILKK